MVKEYCAMAIVVAKNKVLYTLETVSDNPRTSLPKGHIEYQESHIQTAIRECMEETGVVIKEEEFIKELKPFKYKFNNIFNDNKLTLKTIYPCIFKIDEVRPSNITEKNILFAGFEDLDQLIIDATFDNIKHLLKRVKKALKI